jgi:hypothetical protein
MYAKGKKPLTGAAKPRGDKGTRGHVGMGRGRVSSMEY